MESLPNHPGEFSAVQSPMWDKNLLLPGIKGESPLFQEDAKVKRGSQAMKMMSVYLPIVCWAFELKMPATLFSLALKRKAISGVGQHALI